LENFSVLVDIVVKDKANIGLFQGQNFLIDESLKKPDSKAKKDEL